MSGLDGRNSKDYSKYDKMSTESLEELLRLDAELRDGEGFDVDEILYISEVIAKREKEHPTGRLSEVNVDTAWETFQTKYLPYVTDGRSLYDFDDDESSHTEATSPVSNIPSPSVISLRGRRRLSRVVSLVAAIAVLLGLMTATAYAMGYDLWGAIAQWTKDTFTFVSASKASDAENPDVNVAFNEGEYADLQAALDAYGITEQLAPTWIPEGFTIRSVRVDENPGLMVITFNASYSLDDHWIVVQINMHQDVNDAIYWDWEKDDMDVITIVIEGCTFYMMENAERQCAVWSKGPFECSIISDLSPEDLYKVVSSIFVKDE